MNEIMINSKEYFCVGGIAIRIVRNIYSYYYLVSSKYAKTENDEEFNVRKFIY